MHILIQPLDDAQKIFNGMSNKSYWINACKTIEEIKKEIDPLIAINGSDYDAWMDPTRIAIYTCDETWINHIREKMIAALGIPSSFFTSLSDEDSFNIMSMLPGRRKKMNDSRDVKKNDVYVRLFNKENGEDILTRCKNVLRCDIPVDDVIWFKVQAFGCGTYSTYIIPVIKTTEYSVNDIVYFIYRAKNIIQNATDLRRQEMDNTNDKFKELYRAFMREVTTDGDEDVEAFPNMIKLSTVAAILYQLYGNDRALFELNIAATKAVHDMLEKEMKKFHE